jgi:hypothetical protein
VIAVRLIVFLVLWTIHKNGIGFRGTAKEDPIHGVLGLGLGTRGVVVLVMMKVIEGEEKKPSSLVWAYTMNNLEK